MRRHVLILLSILMSAAALAAEPDCATMKIHLKKGTAAQKLTAFFKDRWDYVLAEDPEFASSIGKFDVNDRWQDISLSAIERREKEDVCQLKLLKSIRENELGPTNRLNERIMVRSLETQIEGVPFGGKYLRLTRLDGLYSQIPEALARMPKRTRRNFNDMIERLRRVPELEAQTEALLKEGMKRKIVPTRQLLAGVPEQFDAVLTSKVQDSPIYQPFVDLPQEFSDLEKNSVRAQAKEVLETLVYPSLAKLKRFLVEDYISAANPSVALKDQPNGEAWYAYSAREETTTKLTPEEIHRIGLKEVERITKEMEKARESAKFKSDLHAYNQYLLSDPKFYFKNTDELVMSYRDLAKRIDPELPRLFGTLPRLTYGIHAVPDYKSKQSAAGYYELGSPEVGKSRLL